MNQKTTAFLAVVGIILTVVVVIAIVAAPEPKAEVYPRYAAGDLVRSTNTTLFVVVTGYDAAADTYTFQPAEVNLHAGTREVLSGAATMKRLQFQEEYDTRVTLHT